MSSTDGYGSALSAWFAPESSGDAADSFGIPRNMGGDPQAVARVRDWVRARFGLSPDAAILVSEVTCNLPGCPPLETVVAFWENDTRHHFKLFKPVAEVAPDNLPYGWMKESLIVPEGFGCECC